MIGTGTREWATTSLLTCIVPHKIPVNQQPATPTALATATPLAMGTGRPSRQHPTIIPPRNV